MSGPRAIETALDLARMPALAVSGPVPELPTDVLELMKIAAANPETCRQAAKRTGTPAEALIEAARFYLQQTLFHRGADAYRVLGLAPGSSKRVARVHMRWLLQWLHPDRNCGLDAIYTDRVLKAWREVSGRPEAAGVGGDLGASMHLHAPATAGRRGAQIPWVAKPSPVRRGPARRRLRSFLVRAATAIVVIGMAIVLARLGGLQVGGNSFEAVAIHLPMKLSLP